MKEQVITLSWQNNFEKYVKDLHTVNDKLLKLFYLFNHCLIQSYITQSKQKIYIFISLFIEAYKKNLCIN